MYSARAGSPFWDAVVANSRRTVWFGRLGLCLGFDGETGVGGRVGRRWGAMAMVEVERATKLQLG